MKKQFNDFHNFRVAALPIRLRKYIVEQNYAHYTAIDHAVWRYVMRQNYSFLKDIAYYPYIPGLKQAGLTIERIPDLQEMNDALGKIGWGAVTVDGFIPPSAFMEFQEYHVLVIAADIRQLQHIDYTPAPDIIHESAGHAPIIAEPDYNNYLSYFGSIGARAMFSSGDFELYEAIRELSIVKEMPGASQERIRIAEERVAYCQNNIGEPSEMALLSRLHWWTVEYGLIGTLEEPKIYGAGLLSSIGESAACMDPAIKKIWYSGEAINYSYDITNRQPQLFVTPDFKHLINVLDDFAAGMAFKTGGSSGIAKAISCPAKATLVYSSGLQVTGKVEYQLQDQANPCFIKLSGPVHLSFQDEELAGHSRDDHRDGFSSPVGKLKHYAKDLDDFSREELTSAGIIAGKPAVLEFESGITVSGTVVGCLIHHSKLLIVTFKNCEVADKDKNILFDPSWGIYDMAVGATIVSVFPQPLQEDGDGVPARNTYEAVYTPLEQEYQDLFKKVRYCRENKTGYDQLATVYNKIVSGFEADWLCLLEILELLIKEDQLPDLSVNVQAELDKRALAKPELMKLIRNGLNVAVREKV